MAAVLLAIVVVLLPTAAFGAVIGTQRVYRAWQLRRPALSTRRPIEVVRRDLHRLHGQLEEIENAPIDLPGKSQRCRATRAAYVDLLNAACEQLDIPAPAGRPVPDTEIYRVEVELRRVGVDVRDAV